MGLCQLHRIDLEKVPLDRARKTGYGCNFFKILNYVIQGEKIECSFDSCWRASSLA